MSQTRYPPDKQGALGLFNRTLVKVTGQVGCLTLVIIFVALFLGQWLDKQFNTGPLITIVLMVISVPVTMVVIFWVVKRVTARNSPSPSTDTQISEEGVDRDNT
jgi:formate hydrogenlyase subunit 4